MRTPTAIHPIGSAAMILLAGGAAAQEPISLQPTAPQTPAASDADRGSSLGSAFELTRFVIASGGGRSSGGAFTITGTIGQPLAATSAGGAFSIRSGFWSPRQDPIGPCNPADIAQPFGLLDGADVNAFISAFGISGSLADLNNDGTVDGADVNAFISAFGAGCP